MQGLTYLLLFRLNLALKAINAGTKFNSLFDVDEEIDTDVDTELDPTKLDNLENMI